MCVCFSKDVRVWSIVRGMWGGVVDVVMGLGDSCESLSVECCRV